MASRSTGAGWRQNMIMWYMVFLITFIICTALGGMMVSPQKQPASSARKLTGLLALRHGQAVLVTFTTMFLFVAVVNFGVYPYIRGMCPLWCPCERNPNTPTALPTPTW